MATNIGEICTREVVFGTRDMLALLSRQRWISLIVGVSAYASLYLIFFEGTVVPSIARPDRPLYALLSGVNTMATIRTPASSVIWLVISLARYHLRTKLSIWARLNGMTSNTLTPVIVFSL